MEQYLRVDVSCGTWATIVSRSSCGSSPTGLSGQVFLEISSILASLWSQTTLPGSVIPGSQLGYQCAVTETYL